MKDSTDAQIRDVEQVINAMLSKIQEHTVAHGDESARAVSDALLRTWIATILFSAMTFADSVPLSEEERALLTAELYAKTKESIEEAIAEGFTIAFNSKNEGHTPEFICVIKNVDSGLTPDDALFS